MVACQIFYFFVFWLNYSTALEYIELNCNFTKYILNYFKHNEKYLLKLEEDKTNISINDLKMYGKSIQSHGEIVIAMLEALRSEDKVNYPFELMDVNLYLNNVSGSVEMSYINKSGKFDQLNGKLNLLEGFLMIHKAMVKRIENFMNTICSYVSFDEVFTNCPDFNEKKDYRIQFLPGVVKKLKNRLTNNDLRFKDERLILNNNEIFKLLKLALENDSHWDFHPKNLLYYDLMMGHQKFDERNLMSGVQYRKLPEVKDYRAVNVMDYFKFAPLQYQCPDGSFLTLFDVFRYMKYNFDTKQLQGYQELVLMSTIRPILLLVRMYAIFLKKFCQYYISNYTFKNTSDEIYIKMLEIGIVVVEQIEYLNNLNLFHIKQQMYLDKLCLYIRNIIEKKVTSSFKYMVKNIMSYTRGFFNRNKLNNYFGVIADYTITHDNVKQTYNEFVQLINIKSTYLIELESYKESLNKVNQTRNILPIYFNKYSEELFNPESAMINRLCSQHLYTEIYNMEGSESVNYEKTSINRINQDNVNKKIQTNNQNAEDSSKLNIPLPKYMIDYILFI
ncbi:uncharacterized protein LOC126907938 isoform X1 [Daktulosphaira vitifoliae]|uniref:uncharacterized protein LOC126907938 isoform X1 n=1 Tax=Daktulosphaira vitifoliae TaxID=58002 RepID=UPI0021AA9B7D|nr:uncharacterized protein LOC126907938 isoform X1 [Daktulosphaira vitifoliae]